MADYTAAAADYQNDELYALMSESVQRTAPQSSRKKKFEGRFGGSKLHGFAKSEQWTLLLASATEDLLYILDEHHRTPLHYAIEHGASDEVLLELIRLGPFQVRLPDSAKETPVHLACDYGVGLIVAYALLQADVQFARGRPSVLGMKNANHKTPLDLIRSHDMTQSKNQPWKTPAPFQFSPMVQMVTKFVNTLGSLPWKFHSEEHAGVLQVVEEAASGNTGVVGMAY